MCSARCVLGMLWWCYGAVGPWVSVTRCCRARFAVFKWLLCCAIPPQPLPTACRLRLHPRRPGGEQQPWVQSQTTFAVLHREEDGSYAVRAVKQKIWVEGVSYELQVGSCCSCPR